MGRSNYSQTDVFNLIESVGHYLPISGLEWDLVAQRHMAYHPDEERNSDQLKKIHQAGQDKDGDRRSYHAS
jgi:hypothetical protein